MKAAYAGLAFFAIYIFAISNTISNAMISISSALLLLFTIWLYCKEKLSLPLPAATLQIPWWTFLVTVLIASILVWDGTSIKMALDYFYLSLPFWLLLAFYYHYPRQAKKTFLISIALSLLIIGLKSGYVFYFINHMSHARVETFDHNLNGFGTIIGMSIPFMFALVPGYIKKNTGMTVLLTLGGCLGLAGLILTGSRGAIGGLVIGGLLTVLAKMMFFNKSHHLTSIIAVACLCFVVSYSFITFQGKFERSYDEQRLLFIRSSYAMWLDHPVIGVGLNNWEEAYYSRYILPQATEKGIPMPHNTIAYYFSTTGVLGGIGFLIFTLGILSYLCKHIKRQPDNYLIQAMLWSFLAVSIHGLVDAGLSMRTALRLCSAYLGVTVASIILYEKGRLKAIAKQKYRGITWKEYKKQRFYGFSISHKSKRQDFR